MTAILNRYDFVMLFDVRDGNPNGDPDAGNLPRADPQTGQGLVSDVCLKRKLRNYVMAAKPGALGYDIFVKEKGILNDLIEQGYKDAGIAIVGKSKEDDSDEIVDDTVLSKTDKKSPKKAKRNGSDDVDAVRQIMCSKYFDIRALGAVMSTGANAGQVRGPLQFTFARSIDPIFAQEHSITRMAVATQKEAEKQSGDNRTMGRKNTVPYGLYVGYGFVSPQFAKQTVFTAEDLELVWKGLAQMFELDRSAARGLMSMRRLVVFEHESALGDSPAHKLFDLVKVSRKPEIAVARQFDDYAVTVGAAPKGIKILEKV
jgi:CRISPR-associated protein Csd2